VIILQKCSKILAVAEYSDDAGFYGCMDESILVF
jgi:hypothetical protein